MVQWMAVGAVLGYLLMLFLIAQWAERRAASGKGLGGKSWVYALALAVYCTAWTYYGSVGRASGGSLDYLAIYLGPTVALPLWWLVMRKVIRICKLQRISTVADFISSRYGKSVTLGYVVTLVSVFGIIPYISIQLKAISDSFDLLTAATGRAVAAHSASFLFNDTSFYLTVILAVFTALYGARKVETVTRHDGLVTAVAFESVFKLLAFLLVGLVITYGVFDGFTDIFEQVAAQNGKPAAVVPSDSGYDEWLAMLLLSMMAVMFLPRQFQVAVVENQNENHLKQAMWAFPLYLLVINIFVLPIAFSGNLLLGGQGADPDYFVMSVPISQGLDKVALITFLGGFSAATGMIIVSTIALSIMVTNNLLTPILLWLAKFGIHLQQQLSKIILWLRWVSIAIILAVAYLYFKIVADYYSLVSIGLASFAAIAQFVPALIGGIYWKKGNKYGALSGILVGFFIWGFTIIVPELVGVGLLPESLVEEGLFGLAWLKPKALFGLTELGFFAHALFWSMLFNIGLYVWVSVNTRQTSMGHNQAALFVDIFRHSTVIESATIWKGTAYLPDISSLLNSFLGKARTAQVLQSFSEKYPETVGNGQIADPKLVTHAEKVLAGVIGTAAARIMVASVVKEEKVSMEEVVRILRESQQLISYNRELTRKSEALEKTTAELKKTYEQLKAQDALKDEFLYTVTHELRTPITSIKALAEILYDYEELTPEEHKQFLQTIIKESERMARLISQVLDLEKLEAGTKKLEFEPIDLGACLNEALEVMQQLIREKQIVLKKQVPVGLPAALGDRDRLLQVLINLLSNAVKFSEAERGEITIGIAVERRQLLVWVADNGKGIPKGQRKVIFDKFYQAENQTIKKPVGSGLGLAISKKIVQLHGGEIWADAPEEGNGAIFRFTVPAAEQHNKPSINKQQSVEDPNS